MDGIETPQAAEAAPAEATTPVYDISGEEPTLGDMPHSQVQEAVASGRFSLPKGQEIAVISPDGTPGTIPADQAPEAFKNGFQYAAPGHDKPETPGKYDSRGQRALAAVEGAAQGLAGPLATLIERGLGVGPEDIRGRAEAHPGTHGVAEALGFGAGMFTGASEASLVGHAGQAAAKALGLGLEGAGIGSRLAAGATKVATEIALIQTGDEASKAILQDPNQSVGSAAVNVGLAGLLGGVGGGALKGAGMVVGAGVRRLGLDVALKEFTDEMAALGSDVSPVERMQKEFSDAMGAYHEMGSEVGGTHGLKAQALAEVMPEMGPKITEQALELAEKVEQRIAQLGDDPLAQRLQRELDLFRRSISGGSEEVAAAPPFRPMTPDYDPIAKTVRRAPRPTPERLAQMGEAGARSDAENLARANATGFNPYETGPRMAPATSAEIFEATNRFKQQLHEWGKFSSLAPPPISDRAFISAAKGLGHDFKAALENPSVWGRAAELQTNLNRAWSEAIPAVKDAESKFMSRIGNDRIVDPTKFGTYTNQNGKATSLTLRQQMMGKFVEAMEKFHNATALVYERAGVANPHQPLGMTALKESLNKKSAWANLAKAYHDRAISDAAGTSIGAGIGGAAGHATGIPGAGFAGSLLGGKIGEKILPGIIQPLMTKSLNSGALQQAVRFAESAIQGNNQLIKSSKNVFAAGMKTVPSQYMPDEKSREKLDKTLRTAQANPAGMFEIGGDLGHYMPGHQGALAQHAMTAVNYLNGLRPSNPKMNPLDTEYPPSKAQLAPFHRALDIADQPLLALEHIKKSTLLPQDVATMKTIYPALYQKMSQDLMNGMTDHLAAGGKIAYDLRQSLSMFLGQPLDSTMTQPSMASIQAHFQQRHEQKQAAISENSKSGSRPSKLTGKLATSMQTQGQAREANRSKG